MQNIQQLRNQVQAQHRAALALLNEKGDRRWRENEQTAFDALIDDAARAQAQIDLVALAPYHSNALRADQRNSLELYIRKGFSQMSATEAKAVRNTMSTTTPGEGGYSVGPWTAKEIVGLLKGFGWMRQVASQYTTTQGAPGSIPTSDGTSEVGEQLAENVPATNLDPSFGTVSMPTYRFSSKLFTVPIELLQDSATDIVAFVLQRSKERIGRIQNLRFTTGTGSSQPTGLVTAAGVGKAGIVGQTTTIVYADLVDMIDSVDEAHLGMPDTQPGMPQLKAGWMFSQTMRKVVRNIKDTNGRPIWTPAYDDGIARPQPAQLLDYPVYINNDMPVPAASAKSLAFGNLASYTVRDALEVTLMRFDDSAFATKGQVGFICFARAGGNLADSGAVKTYQHSAT